MTRVLLPVRRPAVRDETSRTLLDVVEARAAALPDCVAFIDLGDGEDPTRTVTFSGLARAARSYAARLGDVVAPGSRVLLVMPSGISFVVAFLGCLYARAIPVPATVPTRQRPDESLEMLEAISEDCFPAAVLTGAELAGWVAEALAGRPALRELPVCALDTENEDGAEHWRRSVIEASTTAFLQYTSGSTRLPKGVVLSHGNLLANLRVIAATVVGAAPAPITVTWVPLHHDLGLIGGVLGTLFTGGQGVLLPTAAFLRRPTRWLRAISDFRADVSLAPNFAYDLMARAGPRHADLDLSCWKVAINCSEPIRARTLERFAANYAACGFDRSAFFPCYGLAEASLMVSAAERGAGAIVLTVPGEGVSSGTPAPTVDLAIVDAESLRRLAPGGEGEIWIAGPSVTTGYWGSSAEGTTVGMRIVDEPESRLWLRTGDLGRMLDGQLVVTGRLKDVVIVAGKQLHPQDVEAYVQSIGRQFKLGAGIAFGVQRAAGERLAFAQEVTGARTEQHDAIIETIRGSVFSRYAIALDSVILLRPGTIARTLNGKLRRQACRAAFERGELAALATSTLPEDSA